MIKNILILFAVLSVVACAKNRDVERLRPSQTEDWVSKLSFVAPESDGTKPVYLVKMTVVDTSDSPAGTLFLGYQSNVKAGYFDFTQYHLQFKSITGIYDGSENENIKNSVLMNWNIEHADVSLDESDGQTTNQEIVDNFKTWDQKRFFRFNWADQKEVANQTNIFPVTSFAFFQCWSPVNMRRVENSMKIEDDHIGFNVEVVYQRLPACANMPQWAEADFNFTATFKYSFRKVEGSDYQPKRYIEEQDPARYKYGHFQTVTQEIRKEDGVKANIFLENRWSEKTHYFYFVKGFPQRYKWIWDHTKKESVLGQTNALLESMGSKLRFEIYDYNHNLETGANDGPEREFGDLRYSFVNFIERLEAGGTPLGYGPSDTNPFTGEIIAANTMVWTGMLDFYLGLMESVNKGADSESTLFQEMNRSLEVQANSKETAESLVSSWNHEAGVGQLFQHMAQENRFAYPYWNSYTAKDINALVVENVRDQRVATETTLLGSDGLVAGTDLEVGFFSEILFDRFSETKFGQLLTVNAGKIRSVHPLNIDMELMENLSSSISAAVPNAGLREMLKVMNSLNSFAHKDVDPNFALNLRGAVDQYYANEARVIEDNKQGHCIIDIEDYLGGLGSHVKFGKIDLSNPALRKDIINTVLYRVSIHEFGHNLNLRHNFYGSVDQSNFGLGKSDSIANFPGSNGLKKFDVVADGADFQYVEVQAAEADAAMAPRNQVSSSVMDYIRLEDELNTPWAWEDYDVAALRDSYQPEGFNDKGRLYLFCTDEHTATSALCNRHDFGTTPSQILMSQIRSYDERYEVRNTRFGRAYWSTAGYSQGMIGTMMSMKEFLPLWRTGLAPDMLNIKLDELGVSNKHEQARYVEEMDREMINVMKLTLAFYDGVLQQSRTFRDYRSEFDPTTGATKNIGIMPDKIFAMLFMAGDDAIFYNPNRIMNYNSYLTYSNAPGVAEYADSLWRNLITNRNPAMDPWFINFARFQYAKNASNFSNLSDASLLGQMKIIKVDNAVDLESDYGINMAPDQQVLEITLPKARGGTYAVGTKVVVIHIDGSYYMTSVTEGNVTYTLMQNVLSALENGDDDASIAEFKRDIREFHWLYELAQSGSLQ